MKQSRNTRIIVLVLLGIIIALLLYRVNLSSILHVFVGVSWWWVCCAVSINIANSCVEARRWNLILSAIKKEVRYHVTLSALLVGVVGNIFLPLRLGEAARAYFLSKKEGIPLASVASSVLLDRIIDVTLFLILVAITPMFFHFQTPFKHIAILSMCICFGITLGFVIFVKTSKNIELNLKGKLGAKIAEQISLFVTGLSFLRSARIILPTSILGLISWWMRLMIIWSMFRAFHFYLPFSAAVVTLLLVNLGIAFVGTPANIGGFELSAMMALKFFSVRTELGVSYALALHLIEVVPIVIMGTMVILLSGFEFNALRRL